MEAIQFIQTSPDQLQKGITDAVRVEMQRIADTIQPPTEQLLTPKQAGELLDVDVSTLWHWRKKLKIKAYGLGNRIYYKRSELMEALTPLA